jgi:hypothetical protein
MCLAREGLVGGKNVWGGGGVWGKEGQSWRRHRRLFVWEDELLKECIDVLSNIVFQDN